MNGIHRMFVVTAEAQVRELSARIKNLNVSLESLKNKTGDYAAAHRALLVAHEDARAVYQRHLRSSRMTPGTP